MRLLRQQLGDISYNLVFHTAPFRHDRQFHWHVHIWPKLVSVAGFERGTGVMINITPPEFAASQLRHVGLSAVAGVLVRTEIDASPTEVWRVVSSIADHVVWMDDAVGIEFTSPRTSGVGTTFDCETRVGPIELTDHMEVTEWVEGRVDRRALTRASSPARVGSRSSKPPTGAPSSRGRRRCTSRGGSGDRSARCRARGCCAAIWTRNLANLADRGG